jgi:hypothetical protein
MNELQEYLFENKEQLKEVHYLDLMNLCLKLHKKINEPVNNRLLFIEPVNNDRLFNHTSLINISNEQWNESFLEDEATFFDFIRTIVLNHEEYFCDTKITFPSILSTFQRQKIHIYIATENSYIDTPCISKSMGQTGDRKISIYLSAGFIYNLHNE